MTPIEQAIETLERSLKAISCAVFGTDTYKVCSRGDFVSKVEKEIQATLAALRAQPDDRDLVKRLRHTASKGVSVWGDLMIEAADALKGKDV